MPFTQQKIDAAIREALQESRQFDFPVVPDWRPGLELLKKALTLITKRLDGLVPDMSQDALANSGFLKRAALDLLGPCLGVALASGDKSPFNRERAVALANRVVDAQVEFARSLMIRVLKDHKVLKAAFGTQTITPTAIHITGSDPHKSAQRVVILSFGDTQVVYKPSDLTFQMLLMGDEASYRHAKLYMPRLQRYTKSLFACLELELPLVRILPGPQDPLEYGYMEHKKRITSLPKQALPGFFRKFGVLAGVTSLMGVCDLHGENCMATAQGPWLIDAEMGFSYGMANLIGNSAIAMALKPSGRASHSMVGGVFAPDIFKGVGSAITASQAHDDDEYNAFVKETGKAVFIEGRDHELELMDGIELAVRAMAAKIPAIRNWLAQVVMINPYVRLALNTTDMMGMFRTGVAEFLKGTLPTAPPHDFDGWLTWYGGTYCTTPAALFRPHNPQTLYSPDRSSTLPVAGSPVAASITSTNSTRVKVEQLLSNPNALCEQYVGWLHTSLSQNQSVLPQMVVPQLAKATFRAQLQAFERQQEADDAEWD
jgi:hypothetical protein